MSAKEQSNAGRSHGCSAASAISTITLAEPGYPIECASAAPICSFQIADIPSRARTGRRLFL
jgi:hypothetical protein